MSPLSRESRPRGRPRQRDRLTWLTLAAGVALGFGPIAAAKARAAGVDLRIKRAPTRVALEMRRADMARGDPSPAAAPRSVPDPARGDPSPAAAPRSVRDTDTASPVAAVSNSRSRPFTLVSIPRGASRPVVFFVRMGYAVDQGDPVAPLVTGADIDPAVHRATRLYTFGDMVVGSNGLLFPSLSTYFASRFRLEQEGDPASASVPSVYDGLGPESDVQVTSAYGEIRGLGPRLLSPLRVRAGRQFRHGVGLLHFDGIVAAYETPPLDASLLAGRRVALFAPTSGLLAAEGRDEALGGFSFRLRLARVAQVPISVTGDWLALDDDRHLAGGVRIDLDEDKVLVTTLRIRNGALARASATWHARLSEVTTISTELDRRFEDDWIYDMVVSRETPASDPETRLYLGSPLPRFRGLVRAGTVLRRNLDLHGFAGGAWERDEAIDRPFSPTYWEIGGGVEGRLRGGLAMGVELSRRVYRRPDVAFRPEIGAPEPLDDVAAWGERGFESLYLDLRYSTGPKGISGEIQVFGRRYEVYTPELPEGYTQLRSGGRFRIEGWVLKRVRLLAEYEVSGALPHVAPELAGLQSLRLLSEAAF